MIFTDFLKVTGTKKTLPNVARDKELHNLADYMQNKLDMNEVCNQ